ncbi:MAG: nitrous oxide-stimulated promoter family protein [Candidatus Lokiarchaeota archaeon]
MTSQHPRINREMKTIKTMIDLFCKNHHNSRDELCVECNELWQYAKERLNRCPFQERKSTCAKCVIHCYEPQMREKIKKVMRYSGPRMILHHPFLTIHHIIDGRKKGKKLTKRKTD